MYQEQLKREEQQRILDARRKEEERIRLEEQLAADTARLNALKAKKVEIPRPLPEPEPPAAPAVNGNSAASPAPNKLSQNLVNGTAANAAVVAAPKPLSPPVPVQSTQPRPLAAPAKAPEPTKPANSVLGINGLLNSAPAPTNGLTTAPGTSRSAAPPPAQTPPDRYSAIHKNLKMLRKSLTDQAKANPALKGRMGDMRREIRKSVGQLTVTQGVAGVNKTQVRYIHPRL